MALIGQSRWSVGVKLFDDATQNWAADFTPDVYQVYTGQGFEWPEDQNWINRPTGTQAHGGLIFAFPDPLNASVL